MTNKEIFKFAQDVNNASEDNDYGKLFNKPSER